MRWTNYFIHPADNRYYVFTFNEDAHAERFELALKEEEIPFERSENEFGVPRTYFNEALRQNHLLHAEIRKPFIENKGLRWTMLILTAAVLLLAIVGAITSKAQAQMMGEGNPWELSIQARACLPLEMAGVEAQTYTQDGLTGTWTPLMSQSFGVRINNRLKESWMIGTGVEWIRRNFSIEVAYLNDTLGIATVDTIPLLRGLSYRIPIVAETRVELVNGYFITAAGGLGLEFRPSNSFTNDYTQGEEGSAEPSRDYEAYLGRMRWGSIQLMAELGFEKAPKGENPGFYMGLFWSRSLGKDYWIENVWESSDVRVTGQSKFASALTGIEVRILLK